jgi:IS30 family transposase
MKVYFAAPYTPWQRASNEDSNGLIPQHFPKETDFNAVSDHQIDKVQNLLNGSPGIECGR